LALFFHDSPEKPASFAAFEAIPHLVNTLKSQSFLSFVKGIPSDLAVLANIRGAFATISTSEITSRFTSVIKEECEVSDAMARILMARTDTPNRESAS